MRYNYSFPKDILNEYAALRNLLLKQHYLSRWIILILDISICVFSLSITMFLLWSASSHFSNITDHYREGFILLSLHFLSFLVFFTYAGIIRHSAFIDIFKIAACSGLVFVLTLFVNNVSKIFYDGKLLSHTLILFYLFISFILLTGFRIAVKEIYRYLRTTVCTTSKKRVLVCGVDDATISLTNGLKSDPDSPYQPVAFLVADRRFGKRRLVGLPVLYSGAEHFRKNLERIIHKVNVEGIIIVDDSLPVKNKFKIASECLDLGLEVFHSALVEPWQRRSGIKVGTNPFQIEDILEPAPIEGDKKMICNNLQNKTILVTGGAGSFGRPLVLQIAACDPGKLVILDIAETPLHAIEIHLKDHFPTLDFECYLADITVKSRMEALFSKFHFDTVFHAAAYKEVSLLERHPIEAILTNIIATKTLAQLAHQYNCHKFVFISSDKASNTNNVMGATKRMAEMYLQALQRKSGITTKFISTRFGKVLEDNDSFLYNFRQQIKNGGPITIAHQDQMRRFMTLQEACHLVLLSGTICKGGEVFTLVMGKPIRVLEIAEKIVKLSGLKPYTDIPIEITGLKKGEKHYDRDITAEDSLLLPTTHLRIKAVACVEYEYESIDVVFGKMEVLANSKMEKKFLLNMFKQLLSEHLKLNPAYVEPH